MLEVDEIVFGELEIVELEFDCDFISSSLPLLILPVIRLSTLLVLELVLEFKLSPWLDSLDLSLESSFNLSFWFIRVFDVDEVVSDFNFPCESFLNGNTFEFRESFFPPCKKNKRKLE